MSQTDQSKKCLFTPGPLTTAAVVRQQMQNDIGSREPAFIDLTAAVRRKLLAVGQADDARYAAIPLAGSGTSSIEAAFGSFIDPGHKLLVVENGHYGQRLAAISTVLGINSTSISFNENEAISTARLADHLQANTDITHLALVHCETSSGVLNPLEAVAALCKQHDIKFFVDAMSSFGGIPIDITSLDIACLMASANKCIESVPGIAFVLAQKSLLAASSTAARSYTLDLRSQWQMLETSGQFRFTPPTQVMLALDKALDLLLEETVTGRQQRYLARQQQVQAGLAKLGFSSSVPAHLQSPIISSFDYPAEGHFDFEEFYEKLAERGMIIYPGKMTKRDTFRIGNIGQLAASDVASLIDAIEACLRRSL